MAGAHRRGHLRKCSGTLPACFRISDRAAGFRRLQSPFCGLEAIQACKRPSHFDSEGLKAVSPTWSIPLFAAEAPAAGELATPMSATMRPGFRWPCRHGQGEKYVRICFRLSRAPDKMSAGRARSDRKKTAGLRAGYSLEAPTVQQEKSCYCPEVQILKKQRISRKPGRPASAQFVLLKVFFDSKTS